MRWLYKLVLSVLHNTTEGKNYICNFNIKATVCLKFHMWQVNYSGAHVLLYPRCLDYYKWNKTLNVIRKYSERRINCLKKFPLISMIDFFFAKDQNFSFLFFNLKWLQIQLCKFICWVSFIIEDIWEYICFRDMISVFISKRQKMIRKSKNNQNRGKMKIVSIMNIKL